MLYWAIRYPNGRITGYRTWEKDQIIFYNGMFSVPTYFIWYLAPDKGAGTIDVGNMFEFMVFEAPQPKEYKDPDYTSDFIVENIIFDLKRKCFKVTCINYFWKILSTKRLLSSIWVGKRDSPANGFETIKRLLEIGWRDQERMAQISANAIIMKNSNVQYSVISANPEVSILDIIGKICVDNGWEWYLGHGGMSGESPAARSRINTIYIGKKIRVDNRWALPFNIEDEHCQRIENSSYITLTTESIWCEPLLLFGKPIEGRVIWTKMYINNAGCLMTLMIQKAQNQAPGGPFIGLTEEEFIMTLDAGYGRDISLSKIWKSMRSFAVLIGKMYGEIPDEGINRYESPKWSGDLKEHSKDLNHRDFITEHNEDYNPITFLKNTKLTTPFAGDGVGVLYPQVPGYKTLLVPDGEREVALLGPGYFGPNDEVPVRLSEKDFRLQMPNNSMLYYDEAHGNWILAGNKITLTIGGAPPGEYDAPNEATVNISDGIVTILGNQWEYSIEVKNDGIKISDKLNVYQINLTNDQISLGPRVNIDGVLVAKSVRAQKFETVIVPSYDAAIMKKIPSGP